jgi:hypothetical protein
MKRLVLLVLLTPHASNVICQSTAQSYYNLIKQADSLYTVKEYKKAALAYSAVIKTNELQATSDIRYNCACSWALANNSDSAFSNLNYLSIEMHYADYFHIAFDQDLISLYKDARWHPLLDLVHSNKAIGESYLNKVLVKQLEEIYVEDKQYRLQDAGIASKFGVNSRERFALWKIIKEKDSVNLVLVTVILSKYGWLGKNSVGKEANNALFLVIQHSNQET